MEEEKKEIQQPIFKSEEKVSPEEFFSVLKLIAPGTALRLGIDGIVKSEKGALIVVENDFLESITDGGFRVYCKFTPQKLIELSKMDGAIILSKDMKKIDFANVLLTPDSKIKTSETGTRHKAAERTAKQIWGLVIAVSERRKEITIYYKNRRYLLKNTSEILRKANDYIQILEKQRELFDSYLENLNKLELRNYNSLNQAVKTIQKGKTIQKISEELKKYIIELGNEGGLLKSRLNEILSDIEEETNLIIKDYAEIEDKKAIEFLDSISYEELLDKTKVLNALNQDSLRKIINIPGWRILSKTSLTEPEIAKIAHETKFDKILATEPGQGDFLSEDKFNLLKVELERIKMGM